MTQRLLHRSNLVGLLFVVLVSLFFGLTYPNAAQAAWTEYGDGSTLEKPLYIDTSSPTANPFPDKVTQDMLDQAAHPGELPTTKNIAIYMELEEKDGTIIPISYSL